MKQKKVRKWHFKQLWNPDAWDRVMNVLINCVSIHAGWIQHDALPSSIPHHPSFLRRYNQKPQKFPPKQTANRCLLALLHLCRCQSTSQRAQAPLQQTHGHFGTCPAATSFAGTLKAPRRRSGSGKALPEVNSKPPKIRTSRMVKQMNCQQRFKPKNMWKTWRRVSWPRSVIIIVIIIISIIICAILLAEGGSQSQGIGSTLRQCHLTCMMFGRLSLVTYNNRIIVINRFDCKCKAVVGHTYFTSIKNGKMLTPNS